MYLGMAVMAWCNAIGCLGCQDLIGLCLSIGPSLFRKTGLEITAAAATTKIIGAVGGHVDEIFFTHNFFNHVSHVFSDRVTKGFSDKLAGILKSKFNLSFLIPVRRWVQFTFFNPLCVKLDNTFDFKVMGDVKFLQSYQDCEEFVPSLGV